MKFSCDGCFKDISHSLLVQCAECEDVDLCLTCFCNGVELSHHKASHSYRLLRPLDFFLFAESWRADEELLLLEGCEQLGLGNWKDIAEHVGSKTALACEAHYRELFINWSGAPEPNEALLLEPASKQAPPIRMPADSAKRSKTEARPASPVPGSATQSASKTTATAAAAHSGQETAVPAVQPSGPANHEIAGYMPGRREFETETENDAEVILKDLQFSREEDSAFDILLKLVVLDCYFGVLERRAARRRFLNDRGLLDFRKQQAADKARSREDRDTYTAAKAFARFMSPDTFDLLHGGLVREEELRRKNQVLQEYRRHGLRTFSEVARFEAEKKHLELYLKGGSTVSRNPALVSAPKEPFPLPNVASNPKGSSDLASSQTPNNSSHYNGCNNNSTQSLLSSGPSVTPSLGPSGTDLRPASSGGRKASTPLNIVNAEGVEFLSDKEKQICSILRLYPRLYLSIKDTLIREYNKYGGLKRARAAVKIDVNKTSKLYDFFISAGWIRPPASGE
jgi:transcriptional adapter 2-alpha